MTIHTHVGYPVSFCQVQRSVTKRCSERRSNPVARAQAAGVAKEPGDDFGSLTFTGDREQTLVAVRSSAIVASGTSAEAEDVSQKT